MRSWRREAGAFDTSAHTEERQLDARRSWRVALSCPAHGAGTGVRHARGLCTCWRLARRGGCPCPCVAGRSRPAQVTPALSAVLRA
eukprot:12079446-Alexandrium_andersonii.AAC.1